MKAITIITFAEFLEKAEKNTMLIYPHDEETKDRNELGIIEGWQFRPINFSDKALNVINNPK